MIYSWTQKNGIISELPSQLSLPNQVPKYVHCAECAVPTATSQAARLCQECAEVGARPTHWWCPVLLNALCKSLTC